jgi:hypothetical protein
VGLGGDPTMNSRIQQMICKKYWGYFLVAVFNRKLSENRVVQLVKTGSQHACEFFKMSDFVVFSQMPKSDYKMLNNCILRDKGRGVIILQ